MHPMINLKQSLKIAVLGDVMLDHYLWGDTHRISPEAPVPVVNVHRESDVAGGAANVAMNLASLGVATELLGVVGDDGPGHRIREILRKHGVGYDSRFAVEGFRTVTKTRVMVRNQQLCRLDVEPEPAKHCLERNGLLPVIGERLEGCNALIVSDYAKGVITQESLDLIAGLARARGILLAMDPKPKRRLTIHGMALMTPNKSEALELAGMAESVHGDVSIMEIGRAIFALHQPGALVITLGAEGMMVFRSPGDAILIPTFAKEVFDVSGAGDTVIATLTAFLTAGSPLEEAARMANLAAGIVVAKLGTAVVTREELEQAIANSTHTSLGSAQP
jgi:D-glycero-beta-D-manno-heptose-7-phosphate kinase